MEQIKQENKKEQPKVTKEPTLNKKPFWYLFLLANVFVVLGCAITFALIYKSEALTNPNLYVVPTAVCMPIAIVLAILFIWLECKDIAPQVMHFQKKWLKFYIVAGSIFIAAMLFSTIFYLVCSKYQTFMPPTATKKWVWIIYLAVTGVLTLISIGFQRYARFRIDLDVYRRRHGEIIKEKEEKAKAEEEAKKKEKTSKPKKGKKGTKQKVKVPSGGLLDQMDK